MRALPHGAVADALAIVRASQASVTTKDAFEFLVLTAARSGEARLATWDEMDLDAGVWTIPAARMKAKRDHRVPLSGRALAILHDVRRLSNGTGLVFRSPRGKPLSNTTLSKLIKELVLLAVLAARAVEVVRVRSRSPRSRGQTPRPIPTATLKPGFAIWPWYSTARSSRRALISGLRGKEPYYGG